MQPAQERWLAFLLEPRKAACVGRHGLGKNFQSDFAAQAIIGRAVDFAHTADPDGSGNRVMSERAAKQKAYSCRCGLGKILHVHQSQAGGNYPGEQSIALGDLLPSASMRWSKLDR